ncbi:MAG: transposase [Oligoflexia bacterium]|nr:transposase [Oligoflexia bacterium]
MRQQFSNVIKVFVDELFKDEPPRNTTYAYKNFLNDAIIGILGSGSVLISEIARSLHENISLKKTEDRLCSMLNNALLPRESIQEYATEIGTRYVVQEDVIAFDIGDITKKYAKKMDHLYRVHDGSTGELGMGWELFNVESIHWENNEKFHPPLYSKIINADCSDYKSQNYQIILAIKSVQKFLRDFQGVWAFDRLHDRKIIFKELLKMRINWIVRMKYNRILYTDANIKISIDELIGIMELSKSAWRFLFPKRSGYLHIGWRKVRLPSSQGDITLIVVRDERNIKPIFFLTNLPVTDDLSAIVAFGYYLERWGVEEGFRFQKVIFDLENLRTREWRSIQNLILMTHLSYLFISCLYRKYKNELEFLTEKLLKNFYSIDTICYRYYRIAHLIRRLLSKDPLEEMLPSYNFLLLLQLTGQPSFLPPLTMDTRKLLAA